jgi:outer membrane protein assembly factor BamB
VSRPSFKDVVAIDLATRKIAWRFQVDGYRSDHMAISPDGRTVPASASTGNVVHAIDTATGKEAWRFPSGDSPHENIGGRHADRPREHRPRVHRDRRPAGRERD